jgi:4-hydroxy-4-methyl-2-oxoglutarate aldolase
VVHVNEEWDRYKDRWTGVVPRERYATISFPRPTAEVVAAFATLGPCTPAVSDILDSLGVAGAISANCLKPVIPGSCLVGPALTIRYGLEQVTPLKALSIGESAKLGDRDAYAVSEPGDVVVMDNGGREDVSTMGGLSALRAKQAGVAGCIVDGGVRDTSTIRELGLLVWSRGLTPITGKHRVETVEINGPVTCGGIKVYPGDLIIADESGVVVVPHALIEDVLHRAQVLEATEARLTQAILAGSPMSALREILPPERW